MNNKKSIFSIVLSLIIAFAMIFGITLNTQAKTVSAENEEYIKFDVRVENDESISVPAGYAGALAVTYTVTETTGVDALQLRLGYNHTAFTLTGVTTNNATTLGTATKGQEGYLENVVYENANTEGTAFVLAANDEDVLLITATFALNNPTPATAYTFNLYNANDEEELNISYSTAWRIDTNAQTAETATHAPVEIQYVNEAIVYVQGTYDFSLSAEGKVYDGQPADNEEIEITEEGDNAPTLNLVWFDSNYNKLTENPTDVGTYYVVAETEGNEYWQAYAGYTGNENDGYTLTDVEGKVATYTIAKKSITIKADNQTAEYTGSEPTVAQNAYTVTGATITEGVTITKVPGVNAGDYTLTPSYTNANYTVTLEPGTFTITAKNVTVIIADKTSKYGEARVALTYAVDEDTPVIGNDNLGITLSSDATSSSSNAGTYPITGAYTNTNYNVTFTNAAETSTQGTYTITSANVIVEDYFSGVELTYNGANQTLYTVDEDTPDWVTDNLTVTNGTAKNANDEYVVTFTVNLDQTTANNYTNGETEVVFTKDSSIALYELTITADNKTSEYGTQPATLTPVTVGFNGEVTVVYTVKNGNENITLSSTTPVGTYSIVPSATNSNYDFTFGNGTYTVTKTTPVVTVVANNVYYNRELDYTVTVTVAGVEINAYTVSVGNYELPLDTVLDAGEYTMTVDVPAGANYIATTGSDTFTVSKIALAAPVLSYNKNVATWTEVTKDSGNVNLINGTTITYKINNTVVNGLSYTAEATTALVLKVESSNENYTTVQVNLADIYTIEYVSGDYDIDKSGEEPTLPTAEELLFSGEKATEPEDATLNHYTFLYYAEEDSQNTEAFDFEQEITENKTIYAVWEENEKYTITYYYMVEGDEETLTGCFEQVEYYDDVVINYNEQLQALTDNDWFKVQQWYTDIDLETKFVNGSKLVENTNLYANYIFNIGLGDVNANGLVNANDIILYRQKIVGGYEMTVVEEGNEWATVTANNYDAEKAYFLERVADTNAATYEATVLGDNSLDIRDVSTIRMGMVGGYGFSIIEGKAVTGEELIISRDFVINDASDMLMLAATGAKVVLDRDIEEPNFVAEILNSDKDIIIDLHGHTLTLKSFRVTLAEGNTGKILVTNGRVNVSDGNGVYLTAVDGSVHLDDVTLYDDNGLFVIQTADHSLHLFNVVRFLKREIVNNEPVEAPAEVLVIKDSHIVVEETATLTIDKVVVAEIVEVEEEQQIVEKVVPVQEESDAQITISNNSAQVAEVEVQGNVSYGISNYNELVEAAENGGEYTLFANIDCGNHDIVTSHNLTIDLNGYDITFAKWGFEVNNGATLTLNGDGNVTARACALYAQNGGKLVVNGGTYTSTNNPVIATHGNEGRGGNTITINGGEFNAGIITEGYVACGICTSNNDTVVVNAGTFNIENGVGIVARSGNTTVAENVVINITGNEIEGHILDSKHALIPSGKELVIDYASNYPGGTPVLTNNTEYEVYVVGNIVVTNEQELRTALANKVMAIVFGDDISSTDGYLVNYNTTIDLGGYTLTVTSGSSVNSRAIKIATGAELTVLNGTIDAQGTKDTGCFGALRAEVNSTLNLKDLTLKNYRGNGLNVKVLGATATLENVNITSVYGGGIEVTDDDGADGTITGYAVLKNCVMTQSGYFDWCSVPVSVSGNSTVDVYSTSYTGDYGLYVFSSGGTLNIYGGYFEATGHNVIQTSYDAQYHNDAIINVYGGTFVGTFGKGNSAHEFINIYAGTFDHDPTAYVAENHYVVENNGVYTVREYAIVETLEELQAALVGDEKYIGVTNQIVIDEDVTLDLNGKTICYVGSTTITSGILGVKRGATLTINDTVGTGKINASQKVYAAVAITLFGEAATGEKAKVVVNGGTLEGYYYAITGNGSRHNTEVVVNNGTLYGVNGTAIYNPQDGLVTINNGHLKGLDTAIEIRAGHLVINGGEFEALAEASSQAPNGSGTTTVGAIIAVSQHTTLKEINVEINDGTFVNGINSLVVYDSTGNNKELITVTITGGKFKDNPEAYVAEGYKSVHVEDEEFYWVVDKDAIIGGGQDPIVGPGPNPSIPF